MKKKKMKNAIKKLQEEMFIQRRVNQQLRERIEELNKINQPN